MGISTRAEFEEAEKEGLLVVRNRGKFGATSIDIRVKRLFRQPRILIPPFNNLEVATGVSTEYFLESLVEVKLQEEGSDPHWILRPDELYFFLAEEEVYRHEKYLIPLHLITRSSWARYGMRVQEIDDNLTSPRGKYDGVIAGMIKTRGTLVKLRPGDAPAQMIKGHRIPISPQEMAKLIANNRFRISRDGVDGFDLDIKYAPTRGVSLTLDRKIKRYNGNIIDPEKPADDCFEEVDLDEKGFYVKERDFFISSSAEWISICSCYLGWVWHNSYKISNAGMSVIDSHPNAPMIHPRPIFEGKITLENHPMVNGCYLKPGMPIANINLMPLESPLWEGKESRYKGQDEATLSRNSDQPSS